MALYESKSTIKMCVKLAKKRASNFDIHHCLGPTLVDLVQGGGRGQCTQTTCQRGGREAGAGANNNGAQLELTANQNVAQSSLTTFSSQLSCQGGQHISASARDEKGEAEREDSR